MLVHVESLKQAGGIEAIRNRIIDDCALARLIKPHRPIWLGLAEETQSLRAYNALMPIWTMVARTAYVQLGHNPLLLVSTIIGMALLYLLPPLALMAGLIIGDTTLVLLGGAIWLIRCPNL